MNFKIATSILALYTFSIITQTATVQSTQPEGPLAPLGSKFTYQGQLKSLSSPVNAVCDMQFSLWNSAGTGTPPTGGAQIGVIQTALVTVTSGQFTVMVNAGNEFMSNAFIGDARWLQIAVRCPSATGAYNTLTPRQELTGVPYALSLMPNATINGLNNTGNQTFGNSTRQMLNLWGTQYGIGVQNSDLYFRTDINMGFAWYTGGAHSDTHYDPGCSGFFPCAFGQTLMTLDQVGGLKISTPVTAGPVSATTNAGLPGAAVAGVNNGSGYALYGEAISGTAVLGFNDSDSMSAVKGQNAGTGPGVEGISLSPNYGWCVPVVNRNQPGGLQSPNRAASGDSRCSGVYGESDWGAGVYGYSQFSNGVKGSSLYGNAGYFDGRVHVQGDLEFTGNLVGGNKAGYVSDFALNDGQETLTAGDVVVVVGYTTPLVGSIPVARVVKASAPYQTGVVGVVDQHVIRGNALQFHDEPTAVGEYVNIVTLGMYRSIKVDASFAAVHAGDLLVASPHSGYAMKATDRAQAVGAIVGKALGDMATGEGTLPVLVTLQ